ncbi:MFS transporter [Ewingella americana]|uniref:DHA2 family efflux MFS transporter permease subunit n=1 Tax=Ewingella americana TaxID=41202 RepID=A0A502G8T7_9GAMM|nr:MFS transporter [Ewingella americana]TPG58329.1 DHA2 family efflux MFS transporter permease subunit [Ewingella americana]
MKNLSPHQRQVLLATSLSYIIVILDTSIVNVALSDIALSLHSTIAGLQWIVNAYTLTFAALLLSGGALGDKLGAKNIYVAGLLLFAVASLICGQSSTLTVLIVARVLQGIGASLLVPSSLSLINEAFPKAHQRAKAIAVWAGCGGLAMAAGPLLGGIIIQLLGWRSIFLLNVPVALSAMVLAMRINTPPRVQLNRALDLAGQLWVIIALSSSMAVLIQVPQLGWQDNEIRFGVFIALSSWAGFILTERTHQYPMLPLALFRLPLFSASVVVSLMSALVFYGLFFLLSMYFQQIRGWSPFDSGMAFLPLTVMVTTGSFISGKLNKVFGPIRLISGCCVLYAVGFVGLFGLRDDVPYWHIALFFPALGLAAGIITPVATAALMSKVTQEQAGVGAGVLNASRQTGSALGVAIFGGLLSAFQPPAEGIYLAVLVGITLSLLAGVFWAAILIGSRTSSRP